MEVNLEGHQIPGVGVLILTRKQDSHHRLGIFCLCVSRAVEDKGGVCHRVNAQ